VNEILQNGVLYATQHIVSSFKEPEVRTKMGNLSQDAWWDRFQELLDDQNDWPAEYLFKFIAPSTERETLRAVFGHYPVTIRESRKGNYVSLTARMEVQSSDEIIAIYKAAARVPGIIAL
jgi:putative lipoic acid-binding regulatory protein